jgi:hypothetical protein
MIKNTKKTIPKDIVLSLVFYRGFALEPLPSTFLDFHSIISTKSLYHVIYLFSMKSYPIQQATSHIIINKKQLLDPEAVFCNHFFGGHILTLKQQPLYNG